MIRDLGLLLEGMYRARKFVDDSITLLIVKNFDDKQKWFTKHQL